MRVLVLFFVILLSFNSAFALPSRKKAPPLPDCATPFPIDEEFRTEFVGYDKLEGKAYEKEQKVKAKLEQKRQKLELKKAKLEQKKEIKIKNCERSQVFIDQLKASEEEIQSFNENL